MALAVLAQQAQMLFLIVVTDEPEFEDLRDALRETRQVFLDSMEQHAAQT